MSKYHAIIRNPQGIRRLFVGTYKTLLGAKREASRALALYGVGYRAEIRELGADYHTAEKPFGKDWYNV